MADHGKIRGAFNDEQFEAFCAELLALPAKQRTLEGIAAFFQERTGIEASNMAARAFKLGPLQRYVERLHAGRQAREQICEAVGAGASPVDAMEVMIATELQDHFTSGEPIDVDWVTKQLLKLRTSISMGEESRRKQLDLERKNKETDAKLELAEKQMKIRDEQIQKLERERTDWEEKRAAVAAQLARAKNASGEDADAIRASVVDTIDSIMGLKK